MVTYPMCNQTVTLYRRVGDTVQRRVLHGCFYRYEDRLSQDRFVRRFTLICPGIQDVLPGDRVFDGIGPEQVDWESFLPVNVPGLAEAAFAGPWHLGGKVVHWEAGRM